MAATITPLVNDETAEDRQGNCLASQVAADFDHVGGVQQTGDALNEGEERDERETWRPLHRSGSLSAIFDESTVLRGGTDVVHGLVVITRQASAHFGSYSRSVSSARSHGPV